MNDDEQLELDIPEEPLTEEGLEEDIKRNEERRQKEYDEATKGNEELRRRQTRRGRGGETQLDIPGLFEAGSGLRTTAALGTEIFLNTLVDPVFEPGTQIAAGTLINALAQRIRGGEISKGELAAAGLASLIPGGAQGRAITQFAKGAGKGALSGAIETAGMAGIDEGRLPTKEELAAGLGIGAAFGGALSTPQATKVLQDLRGRIQGQTTPITVMAMSPQKVATPGNIQKPAVISPFTGRTLKQQKIGPYPSLPVNSRVIKVNTIEDAKDFVISRASNRKRKTIRTRGQKGPEIYEVTGGEQVMFDVDLRGESYISRRDQLITVPAIDVAQNSRYVLEQIPEDLEYYIRNVYDDELFEQYARYVKAGRNRLNVIKQEMQEEIKSIRADLIDLEAGAIGRPNLIAPTQAKLEDSHILSVGRKGKLVRTGLTPGVQRVLQKSKVNRRSPSTFYGNMTKNFPSESRVYEPPAAYQSFIEFWKDNRARGAGSAFEGKDLQEAVEELRELGLPTSWLEDFFNFAVFDNLIASELNNKDIVKLLKQGYSAEAIFQQRLKKLNREMQLLDIYDFQDSIRDLPVSEQVRLIDERYRKEILAGTNIAVFLDPPEKVPGTE